MEKALLTVEEAAEILSIGRTKAYELMSTGQLPSVSIGRCRRVAVKDLQAFVSNLMQRSCRHDTRPVACGSHCNAREVHAGADRLGDPPSSDFRSSEAPTP